MTKTEYRQYIQSEYWQNRRREFLQDIYGCANCGMPRWLCAVFYDQDIHVDHKNYQRLGAEINSDLQALCPRCHEVKHFGTSGLKAPEVPLCDVCGMSMWGNECIPCLAESLEIRLWCIKYDMGLIAAPRSSEKKKGRSKQKVIR